MKILMASAGLRPKRTGGVPAYVEELMTELQARGHQIVYVDFNCLVLWGRTRLLKTAESAVLTSYAVVNSGTLPPWAWEASPRSQVRSSRRLRRLITRLIREEQPDIVHFQELVSTPVDLLSFLKQLGCTVVLTSQDYYPLCPTIKLFRYDALNCDLPTSQLICKECCAHKLNRWELRANKATRFLARYMDGHWQKARELIAVLLGLPGKLHRRHVLNSENYRARRAGFVEHLQSVDAMICMSKLHERITRNVVGANVAIKQMYLSLESLKFAYVPPAPGRRQSEGPLVFIALNMTERAKGLDVLYDTFRYLESVRTDFVLKIYSAEGVDTRCIQHVGRYEESQLDEIVAEADFGIVPSLWREAYGYVGVEMLCRGLPILASARGAMTEYVDDGNNGLIFDPEAPAGLLDPVQALLSEPSLRQQLWQGARKAPTFKPFARHVDDMENFYVNLKTPAEPMRTRSL